MHFITQVGDFVFVIPSQHIAVSAAYFLPVILFVLVSYRLDQSLFGYSLFRVSVKLCQVLHTCIIIAAADFLLYPVCIPVAWLELNFLEQPILAVFPSFHFLERGKSLIMLIHNPTIQVMRVDIFVNLSVILVGHNQSQGKIVKDAFDRSLPFQFIFLHTD